MRKIFYILLLLLSSNAAFAISKTQTYPDYQIQISLSSVQNSTTGIDWKLSIKVRDVYKKEYVKGWNKGEPFENFDIAGNKTISSLSITYDGFEDAYRAFISAPFFIAMKIQDAGYIPVIQYKKVKQFTPDGIFFHLKSYEPTGRWNHTRASYSEYVTTYYPDYALKSWIEPIIVGNVVIGWKTKFTINNVDQTLKIVIIKAWANDETNILNYDLSGGRTKSEFVINTTSWLDAQKEMFVNSYKIMTKINKTYPGKIVEVQYNDINFITTEGTVLIDLRDGILPNGEMIHLTTTVLQTPTIIYPTNGTTDTPYTITISWNPVQNASEYALKIWKPSGGATITRSISGTETTFQNLSRNTEYNWTIQALSGDPDEASPIGSYYFVTENSNTVLNLIGGKPTNTSDFTDSSPYRFQVYHSGAIYSDEHIKNHSTAIKLNYNEYIKIPYSNLWDIGGSDFTIEFDIYITDLNYTNEWVSLISSYGENDGISGYEWEIGIENNDFYIYKAFPPDYSYNVQYLYPNSLYYNWINVRIELNYSTVKIYYDGTLATSHNGMGYLLGTGSSLYIGGNPALNPNNSWSGFIDNLKMTKGN